MLHDCHCPITEYFLLHSSLLSHCLTDIHRNQLLCQTRTFYGWLTSCVKPRVAERERACAITFHKVSLMLLLHDWFLDIKVEKVREFTLLSVRLLWKLPCFMKCWVWFLGKLWLAVIIIHVACFLVRLGQPCDGWIVHCVKVLDFLNIMPQKYMSESASIF